MNPRTLPLLLALSLLPAGPALAEEPPAPPPAPTLESLCVAPDELPPSILAVRLRAAPSPARTFYERDTLREFLSEEKAALFPGEFWESVPERKGKRAQSFVADGGTAGTVYLFEYASADLANLRSFLKGQLWGKAGRPTAEHPEEVFVHGRFLWVFSFPRADPASEWVKGRLRREFRIPAPRTRPEFDALGRGLWRAFEDRDPDLGLALLDRAGEKAADWSFGWHMRAEFLIGRRDWAGLERAASRALELHDTLVDPLEPGLVWSNLDSRGMALLNLRRLEEAVEVLRRAVAFAEACGHDREESSQSDYNLACALALLERWDGALAALESAIGKKPSWKERAREDGDLAKARERKEFRGLLGE